MSVFDKIQKYAEDAPEAGRVFTSFGKLTMTPYILQFHGKGQKATRIPIDNNTDITGKVLALVFDVDVKEFNPNLAYGYEREVTVQKSKVENGVVTVPTGWSEVVEPSLKAVFGENWADKANGVYVEVQDVADPGRKPYEKTNDDGTVRMVQPKTVQFLRKFKNREECVAARALVVGSEESEADDIPEAIVAQAKKIIEQMNGFDKAESVLRAAFPQYEPAALAAKANPL